MSGSLSNKYEHLKFRYAVFMTISFVLLLWVIKALEIAGGTSFAHFGILPRTLKGTIGIIAAPLIHGDLPHLVSNTFPIIVLGVMLFYFYHRIAITIFTWIYLVTGFGIWLIARSSYHIGASGVVYGMASFLFFGGLFRRNNQLMAISAVIIILYGGMLYGIFPNAVEPNVSWESHLLGGIIGTILAFFYRNTQIDAEEKPDPEDEEENDDFFSSPSITDDLDATYSFRPRDKNPDQFDKLLNNCILSFQSLFIFASSN